MKKSKLASFQSYNPQNRRLAFIIYADDLGCYFAVLIDCNEGDGKKHTAKMCLTGKTANEVCEQWTADDSDRQSGEGKINVSLDGLRRTIARGFNNVLRTVNDGEIWEKLDETDKEAWHELRQHLAFLLLCNGDEMTELDPDQLLDLPPED